MRRGIAIESYKLTRSDSANGQEILTFPTHDHSTRGKEAGNFSHIKPKKDVRKYSLGAVAPVIWDKVGIEARSAETVNSFKNCYDRQFASTKNDELRNALF